MLRWRFELTAARMGDDDPWKKTADGDVGSGNEALDECFARLYAKSTLTIWVERIGAMARGYLLPWWGRHPGNRSGGESDILLEDLETRGSVDE